MSKQTTFLSQKKISIPLLFMFAAAALAACGGPSVSINNAPADVAATYKANCIQCHGTELQGRVGPPTNLQQIGARMTAADIAAVIEEGKRPMPAFKETLTEDEITKLAEWLASNK